MFEFDLSQYKPVREAPKEVLRAIVIWKTYGDNSNYWSCQVAYKSKWDSKWRLTWLGQIIEPEYYCEIPGINFW